MVQNALGMVASHCEAVKNTFNYSVPFLSWLAVVLIFAIALVLYFISLRFLVMVWGVNKFTKKLIRPDYEPNNELLDFLSRVPDDEMLVDYREIRVGGGASSAGAGQGGSSGGSGGGSDEHDASGTPSKKGQADKKKKKNN